MKSIKNNIFCLLLFMLVLSFLPLPVQAAEENILDLNLLSLMQIQITSVGRKEQTLTDVAAAIYVIDQEDIKNTGATTIMELLRRVPGLQVARISSNQWAITARGFNGLFANKLLVQVDGRSIYTPTYSGVYWSLQNVVLKDIERIEIIRGPGATLWGANAVNGVINVITKKAQDSQGGLISAAAGDHEKLISSLRYGYNFENGVSGRVYATHHKSDSFDLLNSHDDAYDDSEITSGGFRVDGNIHDNNTWTLQGDLYTTKEELLIAPYWTTAPIPGVYQDDTESNGGNLLGRWKHQFSEDNSYTVQIYFDYSNRDSKLLDETHTNIDFDFQQNFNWNDWNSVVWGFGYRTMDDKYANSYMFSIDSNKERYHSYNAFVQNESSLLNDTLLFTIGTKLDDGDNTKTELQPSARILWKLAQNHRLWAAVSRAVRTPSHLEKSGKIVMGTVPGNPSQKTYVYGNADFKSEQVIAYETGYRYIGSDNFSVDLTAFYNQYDNLRYLKTESPARIDFSNDMDGDSLGVELSVQWQPLEWLTTELDYSYIKLNMDYQGVAQGETIIEEKSSPRQQLVLLSSIDMSSNLRLNLQGRYVDELKAASQAALASNQEVDQYVELDANICWQIKDHLQLKLVGQNLLDSQHLEFVSESFIPATEIGRSLYAKLTWTF